MGSVIGLCAGITYILVSAAGPTTATIHNTSPATAPPTTVAGVAGQCSSARSGGLGAYKYSGITNSNGYNTYVVNNMWAANSGTTQTVCASGPNNWQITAHAAPSHYTAVQTYPDVQQLTNNWTGSGYNSGPNVTDTPISGLATLTSTYATTNPSVGDFEAAYDIWLSKPGREVMIWVYKVNRGTGGARVDAHTTLSGVPVTFEKYGSELILNLNKNQAAGKIDILQALDYLVSIGQLPASEMISQIDFGWEICNTAGRSLNFAVTNYTITVTPKSA